GNEPQIIKALLFKINLKQDIEEDASVKAIDSVENEIASSKEPAKSILQSIAAELYWKYFQQNRFKFYQRTNTVDFNKKDIATWTSDDLHKKIGELYLASLKDESLLQRTKLDPFDAIIDKGNVRYLRPTLYDFLAHRALDYFKNDERDITRPAYAFEINNPMAFAPANEFIKEKFATKDSLSLHQKALVIFQKLLSFHLEDSNSDALIDADIERINFVNLFGAMPNKDSLYLSSLQNLNEKYKKNPFASQAAFLMAQTIYNKANASRNKAFPNGYSITRAKEILDNIVSEFPKSEGGLNAQNLLKSILRPDISLITEKVNVPGEPFRTLVNYQNISTIYFRLVRLTPDLKKTLKKVNDNNDLFQRLTSLAGIKSWEQDLPKTDDYLSHSVEVKIDELPIGEYALLGSADQNFSLDENSLAAQYFYVSNISFINSGLKYFVLNRSTGQPLSTAKVQVWRQQYDSKSQAYILSKAAKFEADKNGFFELSQEKKENNYTSKRLEISTKNDYLFLDDYQYTYYNNYNGATNNFDNQEKADKENAKIFLFTDRSIYRPAQTVYFKGIGVTKDYQTRKSILLETKDSVTVVFSDANNQVIDSVKVLINDFGSFNGNFKIPENRLNGEFSINVKNYNSSSVSFSVEEYKRPNFYTEFEKVKGSFRVGDTISIDGFAKAYAGNNIDGAKVSYRVTRVPRFLYPWMFWRKGFPQSQPLEIVHGDTTTSADGKFVIKFKAIPDNTIDPLTDPVFDYKIQADVTDINGETRSSNITVPVGYKSLDLQIDLPTDAVINVDSLKSILVSSKNLSGEPETVKAKLTIYKLQSPTRLIRERFWNEPDEFVFSKEEYLKYFPHDEYNDESRKESWKKGEVVFEKSDSVSINSLIQVPASKFSVGWYVAEATAKDKYGQEVKDVKYFQVFDDRSSTLPAASYAWNYAGNNSLQPGETARVLIGTSAKNVFLIQEVDKSKTPDDTKPTTVKAGTIFNFFSLNDDKKMLDFPISENDRGGFGVYQFFVKDNRFYSVSNSISVPWTNKDLDISFDTYRDKTLPGSEEKWKVKISGNNGQKVAAEMLASMYDASLDQFRPHSWSDLKSIWPNYTGYNSWQGSQNFTSVNSFVKYQVDKYISLNEKRYDALNYLSSPDHLDEVVVIGYGSQRKAALSSPIMEKSVNANRILIRGEKSETTDSTLNSGQNPSTEKMDPSQIQIRKNFNETVFFYPELRTDKEGNIEFSFTMPDALTQWKLMTLAHTKDLASGYAEKMVITQKDLMVQPNAPRFLREGDKIFFSAKIVNLGDKEVTGNAQLQLFNASTMNPVDASFKNENPLQTFTAQAGQSTVVNFGLDVPDNFNNAIVYRIIAKAGNISDGEEAAIPVVSNRMLVTESMPLPMRGDGTKDFKFEKLLNSFSTGGGREEATLTNYGLTVEYTTNPVWYAVQALPYLMEYPYECVEQTFNRFYANALAEKIANSSPKIKAVFERWKTSDTSALLSNLQKDQELKSVLLEETPWVLQAQTEAQQKKNIALLFDMVKMSSQLASSVNKLKEMQSPGGGFVWFKGGPDNRYMTQYIVTGIGHLKKLNAYPAEQQIELQNILSKAIPYLDNELQKDYQNLLKWSVDLSKDHLSNIAIQYLYMRSFFPEIPVEKEVQTAFNYFKLQSEKYWLNQSKYM
ncbi:MAG: alpha-2-macroglobulin family protein, partial [Ginsengibacter sp.]